MNNRVSACFSAIVLFAATFALFFPSVSFSFLHFDDHVFVAGNPIVANGFSWQSIPLAFTGLHGDRLMYTPLLWLSFLADTLLFRASPFSPAGFHLGNVILHAANAVLLFFLLRLCTRRTLPALLAAAFWALHPLRVESVAWVTERKDTLSTLFAFASILCYLKAFPSMGGAGTQPPPSTRHSSLVTCHCRKGCQCLALATFAAGLLSKPMLVTLPFLFLLLDYWPLRRFDLPDAFRALPRLALGKWPFFLLSAVFSVLTRLLQGGAIDPVPLLRRISWLPSNYLFYLAKSFWPSALTPMNPGFPVSPAFLAAATLFLFAIAVLALASLRSCPGFAVGLAAFAGLLFPVSGIVFIGAYPVADRYTYLPALGLSIALAALLSLVPSKRFPVLALATLLLLPLATVSHRILPAWRDDDALYARLARFHPDHYKVIEHQFTTAYFRDGDFVRASVLADRLSAVLPHDAHSALARLRVRARTASSGEALEDFDANPPSTSLEELALALQCSLAVLAADAGLPERALAHLDAAFPPVPLAPAPATQFHPLAVWVALSVGRQDLALRHLHATPGFADLEALSPEALLKPAAAVWNMGLCPQALPSLLAIARDAPSNPALLNNVAWILATTPGSPADSADAVSIATQALALSPANPVLRDTLAAALAADGQFDEAIAIDSAVADSLRGSTAPEAAGFLENVVKRIDLYQRRIPFTEPSAALVLAAP